MKGCMVYSRSVIKLEVKHCYQTSTTAMYFLWVQKPNIQVCVVGKHKSELQTPNRHISNTISGKAESEMERGVGSIWCLTLLIPGLLAGLCSGGENLHCTEWCICVTVAVPTIHATWYICCQ